MTAPSTASNDTPRQRYEKLRTALVTDRDANWRTHWQDLGDYQLPRRLRWNALTDRNKGDKRNQKIINNTGMLALRTLRAGMMSGITSPARPWFRLTTPDPDLAEYGPVKDWLHIVTTRLRERFLRSNIYKVLPTVYGDLGGFGTAAMALMEDFVDTVRAYTFPIGSYVLATSDRSVVDTFIRDYTMTVRQLVMRFGEYHPRTGRALWERFSANVRNAWDQGNYETPIEVTHVIAPNLYRDDRRLEAKYKPWHDCYYERASSTVQGERDVFLRESGFDEFPIMAPRWELQNTDDVFGSECPGMQALGDIKALQTLEKRKAEAIERMNRPPLTAPESMRNRKVSAVPGDVTYHNLMQGQEGVKPIYEVKPEIQGLLLDIEAHENRIRRAYFEDLFLMLAMSDRRQITAREVEERHEEKLLMLGPVLEHLNDELLKPAIDRTFAVMHRAGLIPEAPDEIAETDLKVEYISIMHQAQKLVAAGSMDAFLERVGAITKIKPDAPDKVDLDQSIDEYAEIYGVPPRIVVPDDKVAEIRAGRREAEESLQRAAIAEQVAKTANTLAATDTEGKNALTDIARLAGQGAGAQAVPV